MSFESQYSTSY